MAHHLQVHQTRRHSGRTPPSPPGPPPTTARTREPRRRQLRCCAPRSCANSRAPHGRRRPRQRRSSSKTTRSSSHGVMSQRPVLVAVRRRRWGASSTQLAGPQQRLQERGRKLQNPGKIPPAAMRSISSMAWAIANSGNTCSACDGTLNHSKRRWDGDGAERQHGVGQRVLPQQRRLVYVHAQANTNAAPMPSCGGLVARPRTPTTPSADRASTPRGPAAAW